MANTEVWYKSFVAERRITLKAFEREKQVRKHVLIMWPMYLAQYIQAGNDTTALTAACDLIYRKWESGDDSVLDPKSAWPFDMFFVTK